MVRSDRSLEGAPAVRTTGSIRPFRSEDSGKVAELHARVFGSQLRDPLAAARRYSTHFRDAFLDGPFRDPEIESLVYELSDGRIAGFLGASARPLALGGRRLRGAICSDFCVDPDRRGLAGVLLMKRFMAGPQDVSFSDEANATSRTLWEQLGGSIAFLPSMHWFRVLRPVTLAIRFGCDHRLPRVAAALAAPAGRILDRVAAGLIPGLVGDAPGLQHEEITPEQLLRCQREWAGDRMLRVDHTHSTLAWVLQRAGELKEPGELKKVLVRTESGCVAGWYLYYLKRGGISQVMQVAARKEFAAALFDQLAAQAWRQGAAALTGRMEAGVLPMIEGKYRIVRTGAPWMIVHSRQPELMNLFHRGEILFSRLEGEWARVPAPWSRADFVEMPAAGASANP